MASDQNASLISLQQMMPVAAIPQATPLPTISPFMPVATFSETTPSHHFRCPGCGVVLRSATAVAKGPCPSCLSLIEAPAIMGMGWQPHIAKAGVPESDACNASPALQFAGRLEIDAPDSKFCKADNKRFRRTGLTKFEKLKVLRRNPAEPEFEQSEVVVESDDSSLENESATGKFRVAAVQRNERPPFPLFLRVLALVAVLLSVVVPLAFSVHNRRKARQPGSATSVPVAVSRMRAEWGASAERTLKSFLNARDAEGMAQWVIGGESRLNDIREYLKKKGPLPHYTESDLLSPVPMGEADVRKGIHAMSYQPLGSIGLMSEELLLPIETNIGMAPPSLMQAAAMAESAERGRLRQGLAVFVRTGDRMLLDWDTFVQTWDRSLRAFIDGKLGDGPLNFRVVLSADIPVFENGEGVDDAIIRVQDPLHEEDIVRVKDRYGASGGALPKPSLDELERNPVAAMKPTTATVSLKREGSTGKIVIDRVICREFLGVGGNEGDAEELASRKSTAR